MASKLPLPLTILSSTTRSLHRFACGRIPMHKPSLLRRHLLATVTTHNSYGPSLSKGVKPPTTEITEHESREESSDVIDRESFARAFDVAALRVPAEDCFDLESRLRGHLLNWPRIRNVARVAGDEMEEELKRIVRDDGEEGVAGEGEEKFDALKRRIHGRADGDGEGLSPVLYRERLARTFNSRGFVRFRNLAKISRPKRRKNKADKEGIGGIGEGRRIGRSDFVAVEVVKDGDGEEDELRGLLGDEFKGESMSCGKCRLQLMVALYSGRLLRQLEIGVRASSSAGIVQINDFRPTSQKINNIASIPKFVGVLLRGDASESRPAISELVQCKLTLFYNYWQMNEILESLLPTDMTVPAAFETVGHIAHLNLRDEHIQYKKLIAQVVLDKNKPKIKTVVNKIDAIQNDYRTMELEVLAGNHSLVTIVVENGLRFHVDLAKVYWNSRLATERQRLVSCFTNTDVLCDVFAGVGPIALAAAKKVKRVYANDLNPTAVEYLERNCVFNKIERKIEVYNMEGRRFIDAVFSNKKADFITQVVMNLPQDAVEYLDAFIGIYRKRHKDTVTHLPIIHVYGFSKAQDPEFDFHQRIRTVLSEFAVEVEIHRVRLVAPWKWMLCASFVLPQSVAFGTRSYNM
ncbi:hypothetical protein Sjap_025450 [Stephania japonica]|uniref:tRNA (guanine(37)-N1)-methyltransferase n=1 Tax=Stephania japonica TaxID=461633 RepID=A0AAP0E1R5_9MAGN